MIAENSPDSSTQIHRYIRLNELIPELMEFVDEGKMAISPAAEISYLRENEQKMLLLTMDSEQASPSRAQALRMKKLSEARLLTDDINQNDLSFLPGRESKRNDAYHGELLLPEGVDGRLPTVIISHGLNSNGKNAKKLIGMSLAMSGFAVICFDFCGGCRRSLSGGKMPEMTAFTEKEDLTAVLEYAVALESTDTDRLFLLGESLGGFVMAITAAEHPELRAIILYYPAFCIPEDARTRHGAREKIPDVERFGPSRLGRTYSESVWDYDVYRVIGAYGGPVLILHGDHDKTVDISYGRRAEDVYRHAEFVCLPGEIHGFTGKGIRKAAELSYAFLQRVLATDPYRERE